MKMHRGVEIHIFILICRRSCADVHKTRVCVGVAVCKSAFHREAGLKKQRMLSSQPSISSISFFLFIWIFWKVWTLGNWIFFFPLPELLPSQPSTLSSFSLLFISNPRYLQKTYLLAAKRQKIETWALCTVLHLHRGGLIECVETFWILKKSVKMLKRRARQSHAWICLWQTRGSKRKPLTNLNSFIFNTLRYLKTDFSNSQRSKAPFWMHYE